jgi:hypothetical protein
MTGPEESHSSTRPISVAELLAKNGTIGAPPVSGGRRRRRRGNSDAVSVAELTGEIPIITGDTHSDIRERAADPATDQIEEVRDDYTGPLPSNGAREYVEENLDVDDVHDIHDGHDVQLDDAPLTDEEADYAAHLEERDAEPMFFEPPARRPQYGGLGPKRYPGGVGAEEMSPDPLDVDDDDAGDAIASDMTRPAMAAASAPDTEADELPSYLRSSGGTLFGAGLFIGFDQLWKWNNIVALVLSVLVILGLVVGVRVVRKTEDIGSTLIAVAVGALVTLGPLALLQSG